MPRREILTPVQLRAGVGWRPRCRRLEAVQQPVGVGGVAARLELPEPRIETAFGGTHPPLMLEHGRYPLDSARKSDGLTAETTRERGVACRGGRGRSTSKLAGDQGVER